MRPSLRIDELDGDVGRPASDRVYRVLADGWPARRVGGYGAANAEGAMEDCRLVEACEM